ncbi:hypothetical protein EYF80_011791 [Liparis tanakae]|uniref:Uncharacterized protein n=1 Tax=Liparis tanakae TaxID=230148 RepID=A0A4Z2IJR6_9TELE|nr:hypothetical protein EYF80_011791 [Liparis tanakae]
MKSKEAVEQPEKTPLGQMERNPDMLSGERKAESSAVCGARRGEGEKSFQLFDYLSTQRARDYRHAVASAKPRRRAFSKSLIVFFSSTPPNRFLAPLSQSIIACLGSMPAV